MFKSVIDYFVFLFAYFTSKQKKIARPLEDAQISDFDSDQSESNQMTKLEGIAVSIESAKQCLQTIEQISMDGAEENKKLNLKLVGQLSQSLELCECIIASLKSNTQEEKELFHGKADPIHSFFIQILLKQHKAVINKKQKELDTKFNEIEELKKDFQQVETEYTLKIENSAKKICELETLVKKEEAKNCSKLKEIIQKYGTSNQLEQTKKELEEIKNQKIQCVEVISKNDLELKNLKTSLEERDKKLSEYENILKEKKNEINSLRTVDDQLTKNMNSINELSAARNELDAVKLESQTKDLKLSEFESQLEEARNSIEANKNQNENLKNKLNTARKEYTDMSIHLASVKEYAEKLDQFYKTRKAEFNQANETNKELKTKINMQENELARLREENRFQTEKIKTIQYEKEQLRYQKEEMTRKMNEMPTRYCDSMDTMSQKSKCNNHL